MAFTPINPANGEALPSVAEWDDEQLQQALQLAKDAQYDWQALSFQQRGVIISKAAQLLRDQKSVLAKIVTQEMGKLLGEAEAEVEKCALGCEFYVEQAEKFLADEAIESDAGKSYVCYQPLGTVLAIMPWNFPLWQVFRFAAPALMAGNTALLKHASNVPQCALVIESVFQEAGLPDGVFQSLMIGSSRVRAVIEDDRVQAVTLTGSEIAGRQVAAVAGDSIKKSVLELGGSDAFVVLDDANMTHTVKNAVISRYLNAGQSCIAAKRFIVVEAIADQFVAAFKAAVEQLVVGDPMDESSQLAPMARDDLREELHQQVLDSIKAGAVAVTGCQVEDKPGAFYQASILDRVKPGMRAYDEEFFGPVAIVIRAQDQEDAIRIANDSRFGLGGSVWTQNVALGEQIARRIQSGAVFVNGFVKSDPRLPFGGIKASGYGRELSLLGIREFVNAKTVWIQ